MLYVLILDSDSLALCIIYDSSFRFDTNGLDRLVRVSFFKVWSISCG